MKTYSAPEVIDALDGKITYRQLDYWCRYGAVVLDEEADGSGTRRRFNATELAALRKLVDRYNAINQELEEIRDGQAWADLLRNEQFEKLLATS